MIQRKKTDMSGVDIARLRKLKGKQVAIQDFQQKTEENSDNSQKSQDCVPKEIKVVEEKKLKSKAEIRKSIKVNAQVQILNGEQCIRFRNVPTILLDMKPPKDYHEMAQNQNFAMWFKLEDKEYMNVVKQLKPHLKELTFWFNKEDEKILKEFLSGGQD